MDFSTRKSLSVKLVWNYEPISSCIALSIPEYRTMDFIKENI